MEERQRLGAGIEALVVFGASIILVRMLGSHPLRLPQPIGDVSIPLLVWIYVPLGVILVRREDPRDHGLTLRRLPLSLTAAAAVCAALVPVYAAGHTLFAKWVEGAHFHRPALPPLGALVFSNLFLIGLPEEIFFRGYLHTRLEKALPAGANLLGARLTWGAVATAALFNLAHVLAGGHWWQGNVPFGILLSWLRNRTGSVLAPAIVHGLMNVVFETMLLAY